MFDEIQPETRSNRLARGDPDRPQRERFHAGRVRDGVHEVRHGEGDGIRTAARTTGVREQCTLHHECPEPEEVVPRVAVGAGATGRDAGVAAEMFDERDEMVESSPSRRDDAAGVDDDVRESVLVEESAKESAIGGGEHRARARARGRLGARAGARGGVREIERVVGRDVRDEESPAPRVGDASAGRELDRHRRAGDESEVGEETRALEREANLATRRDEVRLAPLGMFQDVVRADRAHGRQDAERNAEQRRRGRFQTDPGGRAGPREDRTRRCARNRHGVARRGTPARWRLVPNTPNVSCFFLGTFARRRVREPSRALGSGILTVYYFTCEPL